MGKKGGWFSAIKKVFTHSSKDNRTTDGSTSDKKINSEKKKKGKGILKNGENRSFLPLFKEPSSIEKILGEADELFIRRSHITTATTSAPHDPVRTDIASSPPKSASLPVNAVSSSSSSSRAKNNSNNYDNLSSPKAENSAPVRALPQKPVVTSPSIEANNPKVVREPLRAASASSKPNVASSPSNEVRNPKVAIEPLKAASASSKAPPQKPIVASPSNEARNPKAAIERENRQKQIGEYARRPEPTLRHQQLSATKIQAAFRGYLARRSFRALRGLVRLQGVVRGQNVRRQTANAMKQMQLLVRVQTQIQSRRIHMLENQQELQKNKEIESTLSKWTNQLSEMDNENWDDSVLTKEEADARLRKKVEAVIKRERAMAYAYSHQLRGNPNSAQAYQDIRSNGFPWWWNWLERQLPQTTSTPQNITDTKNNNKPFALTPPRSVSEHNNNSNSSNIKKTNPATSYYRTRIQTPENQESLTPRSSKSISTRGKQFFHHTPSRTPPPPQAYNSSASSVKYPKPRGNELPLKDDDSLVSCPPFSAPSYMMPTVSAKAKARSNSNPRDAFMGTPGNESRKRFSFPLTPMWSSKGGGGNDNQRVLEKRNSSRSIGDLSVDSTASMPAVVGGRKPFNRFA